MVSFHITHPLFPFSLLHTTPSNLHKLQPLQHPLHLRHRPRHHHLRQLRKYPQYPHLVPPKPLPAQPPRHQARNPRPPETLPPL